MVHLQEGNFMRNANGQVRYDDGGGGENECMLYMGDDDWKLTCTFKFPST